MFSEHSLEPFRHALYVREDYVQLRSCLLTLLFTLCCGLNFLIVLLSFLECPVRVYTTSQSGPDLLHFYSFSVFVCDVGFHSVEESSNHTEFVGHGVVRVPL